MKIAQIIINLSLDRVFDYIIPEQLADQVRVGVQVDIPFGHGQRHGYVVEIIAKSNYPVHQLKEITGISPTHPPIPVSLIELGEWMAQYYCCSREHAVRTLLPGAVRSGKIKVKTISLFSVADRTKAEEFIKTDGKRSKAKARLLKALLKQDKMLAENLLSKADCGRSILKALLDKDLVIEEYEEISRDPYDGVTILKSRPIEANPEQRVALAQIAECMDNAAKRLAGDPEGKGKPHTVLLHGVTGSGKTEVYLQSIAKALETGLESIVLVPEISLTPQTVERFRARFGNMVSVLHSGLSNGERYDEWTKVNESKVKIVVGARSALFAPFKNLALIIVDEEHENSYKQGEAPRYHARDVAVMRGYKENAVVILGSATPSFESYHNAVNQKYVLAELKRRVDKCLLPQIQIIDMTVERSAEGGIQFFSKQLKEAIRLRIIDGEQTILFLNRRGYARQMMCDNCGYVAECKDCSSTYTYHRANEQLVCHLCSTTIQAPTTCPACHDKNIKFSGLGTEKIESMVNGIFPDARVARMDSDTMTKRSSYEHVLDKFKRGQIDILIGTQMIAKGLHFPNVTLVGVVNADMSLYIPDFRAEERTFQLLTQVAGRAGRGDLPGNVIIQTNTPFNPAIQATIDTDYKGFYEEEIEVRHQLSYPPQNELIVIHFRGTNELEVVNFAGLFHGWLTQIIQDTMLVGAPMPSPIERIKTKFRYQIMIRGPRQPGLRAKLRHLVLHVKRPKYVEAYIDVDATSLM